MKNVILQDEQNLSFFLNIKFQKTIKSCDPLRAKICVWPWPGAERGVPNSAWNTLSDRGHGFAPWYSFPWSGKSVAQVGLRVSCWVWARSVNFCTGHELQNKDVKTLSFLILCVGGGKNQIVFIHFSIS